MTEAGLRNLLTVAGDNKYYLGRWLSRWAVGAPGLENAVAVAAISQGHLGQARALFHFGLGAPEQGRTRRYNLAALDDEFDTWAQAVATLYLVDPAIDVVLRALGQTQDEVARRVGRVLEESRFHADFARGRLIELTRRWETGRGQLDRHLRPVLTEVLCWFGPAGEAGVEAMRASGMLNVNNEDMRQRYLGLVAPTLLEQGYDLGLTENGQGWTYGELPWTRWNRLQRRLET